MRRILPAGVLALAFAAWAPTAFAFPAIEGWNPAGEIEAYGPEDLWKYIDGAADLFVSYGFRNLEVRDVESGNARATVQIYEMGTALAAFGVLATEGGDEGLRRGIGAGWYFFPPEQILLAKDRFYVKVGSARGEIADDGAEKLARAVARALPGADGPPEEFSMLPAGTHAPGSARYARKGFLGLSEMPGCVHAPLADGPPGALVFAAVPGAEETLGGIWGALASRWIPAERPGFPALLRQVPYRGWIGAIRSERGIVGLAGFAERDDLLARLASLARAGGAPDAGAEEAGDRYPVRRLSTAEHQEGFPAWAPDGKTIVFENVEEGHYGLFKVSPEGGSPVRFTSFIGEHPKWSPDGHYLVFDAEFGDAVKIVSAHGGRPVRLVPASIPIQRGGNPVWSPDGSRIAFKSGPAVWVLEIETGAAAQAFEAPGKVMVPSGWSRDGTRILLWMRDPETRLSGIWSVVPGGEARELFAPAEGMSYRYPDESPDGSLVAFARCDGRACDLWAAPSDGGKAVRLTAHPGYEDSPSWSPDGTKLAFTSARTGKMDIYVMDLDLADLRRAIGEANE